MGQALINLFHQKAPRVRFREGFGMTEGGPAITFTRGNLKDTMGSSGQLLPNMRSTFTFYIQIFIDKIDISVHAGVFQERGRHSRDHLW